MLCERSILCTKEISSLLNSVVELHIVKQSIMQETPYVAVPYFVKKGENSIMKYELPTISFGIEDQVCYLYASQNKQGKQHNAEENTYVKQMKRKLYQLNANVMDFESEEYQNYCKQAMKGEEPENMSRVSPANILGLFIFLHYLERLGIKKVVIPTFLPIRYQAKQMLLEKKKMQDNITQPEVDNYKHDLQQLQLNLTDKWIRNFFRLQHHFPNCKIVSFPMLQTETLQLQLEPFEVCHHPIFDEILHQWTKEGEIDYAFNQKRTK